MTTSSGDIISDGTDGRGEASAGSRTSFGRAKSDPAEAETVSGSKSESSPAPPGVGGFTSGAAEEGREAGNGGDSDQPAPKHDEDDELARVRGERDEYLDLARRAQADFENYRKRVAKDLADARSKAVAGAVRELLPVVDNIERALRAAEDGGANDASLVHGVRMVHEELHGFLARLGLEVIETDGETFDPAVHEAIASVPVDGIEAGTITEVHQHGYRLGELVVRPARVVVSA